MTFLELRPRPIEGPTRRLLAGFNDRIQDQRGVIEVLISFYRAVDVYALKEIPPEMNTLNVEVPP